MGLAEYSVYLVHCRHLEGFISSTSQATVQELVLVHDINDVNDVTQLFCFILAG